MAPTSFRGSVPVGNEGYWGEMSSSTDWCEMNYVVSFYVAEYWNAISSLMMSCVGVAGLYLHRNSELETRFHMAFGCVTLIGLGSTAFHTSMTRVGQLGDQLPMLYTGFATLFIVLEHDTPLATKGMGMGVNTKRGGNGKVQTPSSNGSKGNRQSGSARSVCKATNGPAAAAVGSVVDTTTTTTTTTTTKQSRGKWLPLALTAWSLCVTFLVTYFQGPLQLAIFHLSFAAAELFSLWRMYCIYTNRKATKKNRIAAAGAAEGAAAAAAAATGAAARGNRADAENSETNAVDNDPALAVFRRGMGCYLLGLFVWQTDLRQCEFVSLRWPELTGLPNPQLHAWWHVLVSLGFYALITFAAFDRHDQHSSQKARMRWACWGLVPYVETGGAA